MVISVEDRLKDIKDGLGDMGYETYSFSDGKTSDIYIYSQSSLGFSSIYNSVVPTDGGSFILNADDMSIEEIVRCIKNRTYTPIFE